VARPLPIGDVAAHSSRLELKDLNYDQYRDIRFNPQKALWRKEALPFEVMFFHLGKFQTQSVAINEIDNGVARHVPFDRQDFNYGKNKLSQKGWGDLGFAGFRVHYALNNPAYKDELVVFLGASYFRALGKGQHYGLSARGLAHRHRGRLGRRVPALHRVLDRAPGRERHLADVIHALLDSPRATGAYRFTLRPGDRDRGRRAGAPVPARRRRDAGHRAADQHVPARREPAARRRLPPRGARLRRPDGHHRHGEWLWRPLVNPKQTLVTSFACATSRASA
jgi:glucans biosynthesis protein